MIATLAKIIVLVSVTALFAWVLFQLWTEQRSRAARRAAFLDGAKSVLDGGTKAISPTGFPRISGSYRGYTFDLQVSPDTLNYRKLPALWLLVSLVEPQPVRGTFDLMIRPRGVETFSNFSNLPHQIDIPEGFPADCAIRTDDPMGLPDLHVLRRHIDLIDSEKAKELIVSPKGLRAVWLAEEAQRSSYLFFRDSEMGLAPYDSRHIRQICDDLIALHEDLANASQDMPA